MIIVEQNTHSVMCAYQPDSSLTTSSALSDHLTKGRMHTMHVPPPVPGERVTSRTLRRATYPDAVPGADVVVEATRTGFEQYVENKQRPSTKDHGYPLSPRAQGLRAEQQPHSSVLFTDRETGQERAVTPARRCGTRPPTNGPASTPTAYRWRCK